MFEATAIICSAGAKCEGIHRNTGFPKLRVGRRELSFSKSAENDPVSETLEVSRGERFLWMAGLLESRLERLSVGQIKR
jgi:hypothetical protein